MRFVQTSYQFPLNDPVEGGFSFNLTAFSLPNTLCPACGSRFGFPGICYPGATGKAFPPKRLAKLKAGKTFDCPWEEFVELRALLREEVPENLPIAPGSSFGQPRLKVRKEPPTVWQMDSDSLIISASALEKLTTEGVQFRVHPVETVPSKWDHLRLFLADAPPVASSGRPEVTLPCSTCDSQLGKAPGSVLCSSIPDGVEIFKLRDRPDRLIMTERLATLLRSFPGSNINVEPIEAL